MFADDFHDGAIRPDMATPVLPVLKGNLSLSTQNTNSHNGNQCRKDSLSHRILLLKNVSRSV